MAVQISDAVRNARLNAIETTISNSPILRIYTGTPPASCADAASGTLLAEMTLPSDWLSSASGGNISKSGTWQDTSADNTGTAGYFRIYDSTGTTCHMQGTVTQIGYSGDLTFEDVDFVSGNAIVIASFVLTDGNS